VGGQVADARKVGAVTYREADRDYSLGAILYNADYRPGVYGVAIVYLVAVAYFAVAGRHRLVLSPEEEFALSQGEHGHPETEGYGRTRAEDYGRAPVEESAAPELGS
jgi:ethanolamine permease